VIVRNRGFSLLELLVVLTLMGLLYALVPPLFATGASGAELKAAARQVAAGLRKTRGHAIVTKQEALLTVDVEHRTFQLSGDTRVYALPGKAEVSVYTAQSEVAEETTGSIRFYPDGSSTGGRITVASGERRYRVDVDWLTGRVVILD
jgi:general secretion pathway protein H